MSIDFDIYLRNFTRNNDRQKKYTKLSKIRRAISAHDTFIFVQFSRISTIELGEKNENIDSYHSRSSADRVECLFAALSFFRFLSYRFFFAYTREEESDRDHKKS